MIRDAVIHIPNEQPLLADLPEMPLPGDNCLVCTNLRTMDRKRPGFADRSDSVFVFPYERIRFVEIPTLGQLLPGELRSAERPADTLPPDEPTEDDTPIDEDFLRRVREA